MKALGYTADDYDLKKAPPPEEDNISNDSSDSSDSEESSELEKVEGDE